MSRFTETLLAFGVLIAPGVDEELKKAHAEALLFDPQLERSGSGLLAVFALWAGREIVKLRTAVAASPLGALAVYREAAPTLPAPLAPPSEGHADTLERALKAETEVARLKAAMRGSVEVEPALEAIRAALGVPQTTSIEALGTLIEALVRDRDRQMELAFEHKAQRDERQAEVETMRAVQLLAEERHAETMARVQSLAAELEARRDAAAQADLVIAGHKNQAAADRYRIDALEDIVRRRDALHTQTQIVLSEQRDLLASLQVQLDEAVSKKDTLGHTAASLATDRASARAACEELSALVESLSNALLRIEWTEDQRASSPMMCPECHGRDWGSGEKVHGHRQEGSASRPCALDEVLTKVGLPTQLQRNAQRAVLRAKEAGSIPKSE